MHKKYNTYLGLYLPLRHHRMVPENIEDERFKHRGSYGRVNLNTSMSEMNPVVNVYNIEVTFTYTF